MKLLIFLGNPGLQYEKNRHNIGFLVGDELAKKRDCPARSLDKNAKALITSTNHNGDKLLLIKPQTFMNLSGQTISFLIRFYKLTTADILVVHDDIDLPRGTIRYKFGGSAGGQNGIKDTITKIATDQFARIKIGVDRPLHSSQSVADYVLSNLSQEELDQLPDTSDQVRYKIQHHFLQKDLQDVKK